MNNRPPGGSKPAGNFSPPGNSSFFGNKPSINNGLNANSGYTWVNPKQNPLSPEFIPPKSSPVSRIPPKLPPVPKAGLGLGKMAAGLRGGLPGIALTVGLTLLELWLDQPAPPPPSSEPIPPGTTPGDYALDPSKTYLVNTTGNIREIQTWEFGTRTTDFIAGAAYSRTDTQEGPRLITYVVYPAVARQYTISNIVSVSSPTFQKITTNFGDSAWGYFFYATASNGSKTRYDAGQTLFDKPGDTYQGIGTSITIKESGSNQPVAPITSPTPYPAPPLLSWPFWWQCRARCASFS